MEITKIQFKKNGSNIWNTLEKEFYIIKYNTDGERSIEFLRDLPLKCQVRIESSLPPVEEIVDCDFSIIKLTKK